MVTLMLGLSMIGFAGCALSPDLGWLIGWRAATGVVSSASVMLGMAYIGDTVPLAQRQAVMAQYMGGNVLGHALGPFVGGVFTDLLGWRYTFAFLSVFFGLVGLILYVKTHRDWRHAGGAAPGDVSLARYLEVLRSRPARMVMAIAFAETFFFFGAFAYLGAMLKERFDLSYTLIGLTLAGFGAGGLLFAFAAARLLRRFHPLALVLGGGSLVCACYVATAALDVWWPIVPTIVLLGLGFNMLHNTLQIRATEMSPRSRGIGLALFSFAWILGQAIGVAVMGMGVARAGYAPMIAAYGVGFLLLALWMRVAFREVRPVVGSGPGKPGP
jgi:predicted MFS family arabinose efflux permease